MCDGSGDSMLDALLHSASGGDPSAMAIAFNRYRGRLERMVQLRLDVRLKGRIGIEDVIHDVFLEALDRLPMFLRERKLPFFLWLRFLTGQKLVDIHRYHGAQRRDVGREQPLRHWSYPDAHSAVFACDFVASQTTPSGKAIGRETRENIARALDALEPLDREVIVLRHYEQLSNEETAQAIGITPNAASQRHLRALKRLRAVLETPP